jgi:hypothetical protein
VFIQGDAAPWILFFRSLKDGAGKLNAESAGKRPFH